MPKNNQKFTPAALAEALHSPGDWWPTWIWRDAASRILSMDAAVFLDLLIPRGVPWKKGSMLRSPKIWCLSLDWFMSGINVEKSCNLMVFCKFYLKHTQIIAWLVRGSEVDATAPCFGPQCQPQIPTTANLGVYIFYIYIHPLVN